MASEIYVSTNPADWTRLEGLYISERTPPAFVVGRDLSTVGMATRTVRGPLTPQVITSPARFLEIYGGRDFGSGGAIVNEGWKALLNKRFGRIVVRRVTAAAAAAATVTLDDTPGAGGTNIITVAASSVGAWGNDLRVSIENATSGVSTQFNLRVKWAGRETLYQNLDTSGSNNNLLAVLGDDLGNLVVVTKLANGRPHNQTDTALSGGSDGSIADSDYVAGLTDIANYEGVSICLIPEAPPTPATVHTSMVSLAGQVSDRVFLTWSGVLTNTPAQEISAISAQITTRSDRIIWCYNPTKTLDPETATLVDQAPHVWMASILSQTDVDIHPGDHDNAPLLSGITEVRNSALTRSDLISLRDAGISTLERLPGEFNFRSGVTSLLTPGRTEITRRRMTDFLQLSMAERLKFHVKKRNTVERRLTIRSEVEGFLQPLKDQERIVEDFEINQDSVNTAASRAQGIERMLVRVNTIDHILHFVLDTEIGSAVEIQAAA
jgi:hypothetical protein